MNIGTTVLTKLKHFARLKYGMSAVGLLLATASTLRAAEVWVQSDPATAVGSPSGSGTVANPFRINPADDLAAAIKTTWNVTANDTIFHLSAGTFRSDGI